MAAIANQSISSMIDSTLLVVNLPVHQTPCHKMVYAIRALRIVWHALAIMTTFSMLSALNAHQDSHFRTEYVKGKIKSALWIVKNAIRLNVFDALNFIHFMRVSVSLHVQLVFMRFLQIKMDQSAYQTYKLKKTIVLLVVYNVRMKFVSHVQVNM